jgi:hypothetical protein
MFLHSPYHAAPAEKGGRLANQIVMPESLKVNPKLYIEQKYAQSAVLDSYPICALLLRKYYIHRRKGDLLHDAMAKFTRRLAPGDAIANT